MKKIITVTFTIFLFLNSCAQSKSKETFEGIITYNISVEVNTDNENYNEYQNQKYGNKLKLYISKDGSFKREFLNSGKKGFSFFTYNSLTNKSFIKWKNIDTIYSSNCAENVLQLIEEKDISNETIMGIECNGYYISGLEPKSGQIATLTYFYPKDKEYINPSFYKNYNDFFYNKVIEKMKSPFYKLIMEMGKYTVTFTIENIENKIIQEDKFNLPSNIPIQN